MLRGGALKPTGDRKWVHIICAISIAEATFEDLGKRGPINIGKVPLARSKLVGGFSRFWAVTLYNMQLSISVLLLCSLIEFVNDLVHFSNIAITGV